MNATFPAQSRLTLFRFLVVAALVVLSACDGDEPTASRRVPAAVTVSLETTSIEVGQTVAAAVVAFDQDGAPIAVRGAKWTSVQSAVAGVDETSGRVRAIAPGSTRIVASIDGVSGERTITVVAPAAIRLNEIATDGPAPTGWIELFNATDGMVDLSGWTISDETLFGPVFTLPPRTTIPARGFLVIEETVLPFGIDAIDDVRLISRYGTEVDRLLWVVPATGANGRCPDGATLFVPLPSPTKGATNVCPGVTGS
jgi:hypothetical protein